MAGAARESDAGKVAREVVTVTAGAKRNSEGEFHCHLRRACKLSVLPAHPVNRDFVLRRDGVQEGLPIRSKYRLKGCDTRQQRNTLSPGYRKLVDSGFFSRPYCANQVLPVGRDFRNIAAIAADFFLTGAVRVRSPDVWHRRIFLEASDV